MLNHYLLYAQYYFMGLAFFMLVYGTWKRDIILFLVLFIEGLTHSMLFSGSEVIYANIHIVFYTMLFMFAILRDVAYRDKRKKKQKDNIKISSISKE
jgi:uncharacterized membrane protein YjjP (DUF1212 family)